MSKPAFEVNRSPTQSQSKDRFRNWMTLLLVAGTLAILLTGLIKGNAVETTVAFAAPVSTLAGIAIGWYFAKS
jgi:hypothetical protein